MFRRYKCAADIRPSSRDYEAQKKKIEPIGPPTGVLQRRSLYDGLKRWCCSSISAKGEVDDHVANSEVDDHVSHSEVDDIGPPTSVQQRRSLYDGLKRWCCSSISAKGEVDDHVSHSEVDDHVSNSDYSVDNVARTPGPTLPDRSPRDQTTMRKQNVSDPIAIIIMDRVTNMPTFSIDCCIYRVSGRLYKGYEDFYTPRVVSIGPYHHCNGGSSEGMEAYKFKYLEAFFSRNNLNLDHCLGVVRKLEGEARSYYVEPVKLNRDEFALMLLVDGTFLLELMLRHYFAEFVDDFDLIYGKPRVIQDVYRDLMLIENQIPFFVLQALYKELDRKNWRDQPSLVTVTHEFFTYLVNVDKFPGPEEVKHFVDFIRWYYLPKCDSKSDVGIIDDVPSATAMDEAGVKFEGGRKSITLLDMEFTKGSLRIPHFIVDDWTETLFRNLIAFEQCHDHKVKHITQYMFLMGCMIRTPKDADLLVDREIISSRLGTSEDISTIFNNISNGVSLGSPFYYFSLCKNLNAYCRKPWHRWKAILKRDYFNTPWKLVSTIAAFVLLVLTVIQAVCSIISVS